MPNELPLKVGDTWTEAGPDGQKMFTWHLAIAMRPKLWVFNSVWQTRPRCRGQRRHGRPDHHQVPLHPTGRRHHAVRRTMTIEAYRDSPMPDGFFRTVNPANIDKYHAAIARELAAAAG